MQYGSAGVGSGTHLPCTLLNTVLGVNVVHVPYRGAGPAMQDLIGGRLDYMCDTIQTGAEQAKGGTVKGIAVIGPRRVPIIDLPTTAEAGLDGVDATVWNGFFSPEGHAARDRPQDEQGPQRDDRAAGRDEPHGPSSASPSCRPSSARPSTWPPSCPRTSSAGPR